MTMYFLLPDPPEKVPAIHVGEEIEVEELVNSKQVLPLNQYRRVIFSNRWANNIPFVFWTIKNEK